MTAYRTQAPKPPEHVSVDMSAVDELTELMRREQQREARVFKALGWIGGILGTFVVVYTFLLWCQWSSDQRAAEMQRCSDRGGVPTDVNGSRYAEWVCVGGEQ